MAGHAQPVPPEEGPAPGRAGPFEEAVGLLVAPDDLPDGERLPGRDLGDDRGFLFWPVFPIRRGHRRRGQRLGRLSLRHEPTEAQLQREMARLRAMDSAA